MNGQYTPRFSYASDDKNVPEHSPAHARLLAFANFVDLVAYWTGDAVGQLWISDLAFRHPRLIYADVAGKYPVKDPPYPDYRLRLTWSPDDLHLIVDAPTGTAPDLIYDLQTMTLEQWSWECDRVGISPRTGRLATWCPSTTRGGSSYAVMEWGGEIWYSDTAPKIEIVRGIKLLPPKWIEGLYQIWAWSADGQQIAYFDPDDPDGYLHIASASGERLKALPGGVKKDGLSILLAEDLQWSQDGRRLLVDAYGTAKRPCPQSRDLMNNELEDSPCWQVLDPENGAVLWTVMDSAEELMSQMGQPADAITVWRPWYAVISPDGKLVASGLSAGAVSEGFVVNIETGEIRGIYGPGTMRWGALP